MINQNTEVIREGEKTYLNLMAFVLGILASDDSPSGILLSAVENL